MTEPVRNIDDLPEPLRSSLAALLAAVRDTLADELRSIVLFGSGAENRLRESSDLNILFVLELIRLEKLEGLREPLRTARAAFRLAPLWLLESEIVPAAEAFPEKFCDIRHRHRVLVGTDPFLSLEIPRSTRVRRLKQVLLNLVLRGRDRFLASSLREEQLVFVIADMAGPLRSCAAMLLELEGAAVRSPREALEAFATDIEAEEGRLALERLSEARQTQSLPAGVAAPTLLRLMGLLDRMLERATRLAE